MNKGEIMKSEDPNYAGCPILVGIPFEKWKRLEELMQDSEIMRDADVGTMISFLCNGAIVDYISKKEKERAKKEKAERDKQNL